MSSRYPVLENRPIDQWRVTELREELRRRKIPTRGLKEELVRRLDEALREEMESAVAESTNGLDAEGVPSSINNEESKPANSQKAQDGVEPAKNAGEEVDDEVTVVEIDDKTVETLVGDKVQDEELLQGTGADQLVHNNVNVSIMENCITAGDSLETSMKEPVNIETNTDNVNSKPDLGNINFENPNPNDHISEEDPKPKAEDMKFEACYLNNPVSEDSKPCPGIVTLSNPNLTDQISVEDPKPKPENPHVSDLNCPLSVDFKPHTEAVKNEMSSINEATKETDLEDAGVPDLNNQFPGEDSKPYLGDSKPIIFNPSDQVHEEDPMPHPTDFMHNIPETDNQVPDVSQVKCESISTDSVSINEKNELSDNLNADNFHLEKKITLPEMVQPSSNKGPIGGDFHSLDGQETGQSQGSMEEADNLNAANLDLARKNDSADGGSPEKLNLDRSSGDESMEEDLLESKQIDSSHNIDGDGAVDKFEVTESDVDMVQTLVEKKDINEGTSEKEDISVEKRKIEDPAVGKQEPSKRQRKWNSEPLKVSELQNSKPVASTTPKESSQSTPRWLFTKTDSAASEEAPKERVVPPSQKSPTTSLRIDRFLRPFTLKAVQELLGKMGTVCGFWMDQIKTHCYVTYSSVDEAVETRNALYNLQWPPNGGRLLIAEFVDPQEVKMRLEAPPQPPVAPSSAPIAAPSTPSLQPQQPTGRKGSLKQQLPPPPPVQPTPSTSDSHPPRERLPPPPPPTMKVDPPIVTLDDLFKKTKATPRIYYLPLSEKQVAAKMAMEGKNVKA